MQGGSTKAMPLWIKDRLQWAVSWVFHILSLCPPEYPSSQGRQPSIPRGTIFNPKSKDLWVMHLRSGLYIECTMGNEARTIRIQTPDQKRRSDKCTMVSGAWHWKTFLFNLDCIPHFILWPFTQLLGRLFLVC